MSLPIRTTVDDVIEVCRYLSTKPTGATIKDAKTVIDAKRLDGRKLSALKSWNLIEETDGDRLKVTERGRLLLKSEQDQNVVLQEVIRKCPPYNAIIERAAHRNEDSLTSTEVAAHWHEHFREEVSDNERILNDQAVCFFQVASGAGMGNLVIGRHGQQTRISFNVDALNKFVASCTNRTESEISMKEEKIKEEIVETPIGKDKQDKDIKEDACQTERKTGRGIFVAHGKNKKPLEQLKRILEQFRISYKIAIEEPNLGRPISSKVRQVMESCNCAILIFTADEEFKDKDGNTIWRPSENVIYELGATGYLYDNRLVIMKEEGVTFPSNFSDIGYISFDKDKLEAKAMDILKELIGFGIVKIST